MTFVNEIGKPIHELDKMLQLVRSYFKISSKIFPKVAAKQALEVCQRPLGSKLRVNEKRFLDEANKFIVFGRQEDITCYEIGDKENELVWQGIGKGYIYTDKPDKKSEKISEMVGKILLQFPPKD